MQQGSPTLRASLLALALVPAALILASIHAYGVDVPWLDEWIAIGSLFEKASLGTLAFSDLTAQHNEHRIFFPKLLCLALGSSGRWDVRREMLASFLLAAATAWNLHALLKATFGGSTPRVLALFGLTSLLVFSPSQSANWLKGMQVALFFPPLCLTTALRVLLSPRAARIRLAIAMLLCTVAAFSVGSGVTLWIVLLPPLLAVAPSGAGARTRVAAWWAAGFAANAALYVYGYREPPHHPSLSFVWEHPFDSAVYFTSFLGAPLASTFGENASTAAAVIGTALLAVFVACCIRCVRAGGGLLARSLPWISIGGYAVLAAAMTTVARAGMREGQALSSRYTTFSVWLAVAVVPLAVVAVESARGRVLASLAVWAGAASLAVLAIGVWPVSLHAMEELRGLHLQGKACVELAGVLDDPPELRILHPRIIDLRQRIVQIDRGGYFSPALARSVIAQDLSGDAAARCGTFERLGRDGDRFVAAGRAELPWRSEPPDAVLLACERADGASRIFELSLGAASWSAPFAASKLPADAVSVSAWAFDALQGKAYRLSGSPTIPGH